jgi:hypothetical protein
MDNVEIPPSQAVETFKHGMTRIWLSDHRIAVYTIPDTRRETIDVWSATVIEMIEKWSPNQPYLVMYDFSSKNSALTPYVRHWSNILVERAGHLKGELVLILPNSLIAQVVRILLDRQYNVKKPGIRRKIFFTRAEGIAWLKQFAPDNDSTKETQL